MSPNRVYRHNVTGHCNGDSQWGTRCEPDGAPHGQFRTNQSHQMPLSSLPPSQRSILWCGGREFHSSRVPRRSGAAVSLLPVGAWNTSPLLYCGTDVEYQAGMEGKKKDDEEDRKGPRRPKEKGRAARTGGGRKEARWLIDRVRVWEVGRNSQVQSQRTREPGFGLLARSLAAALGREVNDGHRTAIRFPVRAGSRENKKPERQDDAPRHATGTG